jgi:hypothetical protein
MCDTKAEAGSPRQFAQRETVGYGLKGGINRLRREGEELRSFQAGPYACQENADALDCINAAQLALKSRTQKRLDRGVEGTHTI